MSERDEERKKKRKREEERKKKKDRVESQRDMLRSNKTEHSKRCSTMFSFLNVPR